MSREEERRRLKLIMQRLDPGAKIYELRFAIVSAAEWAASVALVGGGDRRFRFTRGQLFDEAAIGDVRV